jgi:hypothetical protein
MVSVCFREFFSSWGGPEEGREPKYPSEKFAYVGISTRNSAKYNYSNPKISLCTKLYREAS